MTDTRQYLLTRCLRLEAKIAQMQRELNADYRRRHPLATDDDRARLRDLRRRGMSPRAIAHQTGWSVSMVYYTTKNVLVEREVGAL